LPLSTLFIWQVLYLLGYLFAQYSYLLNMPLLQTTSGSEFWEISAKSMMTVPRVEKVWDKQRIK
jgi:hypothetical protein